MEEIGAKLAQKQLDAYNAQDLETFLSVYTEDVTIMEFPSNKIVTKGHSEMRARYGQLFSENPNNYAELISRTVKDKFVIDVEYVTGRKNGVDKKAIAIYEIEGEKISKIWFV